MAVVLLYRHIRCGYAFRRIPLTKGKFAIVDPEDFERLNKYKWHAVKCKNTFYAVRVSKIANSKKRHYIYMHREVIDPPDPFVIDHKNRIGTDNRKANLRPATHSQNSLNRPHTIYKRKNSPSIYKGVTWHKRSKKWRANICFKKKSRTIGLFDDEIEAAKAYDEAAKKHHGEFAVLNFPE